MATRRTSDSTPPARGAPPPPAEKKPRKQAAKPDVATPALDAAVEAALPKMRKRRVSATTSQGVITATATGMVSEDIRRGMIAQSAYLRAERRGFAPGGEAEDWLAAEKEVDALLSNATSSAQ